MKGSVRLAYAPPTAAIAELDGVAGAIGVSATRTDHPRCAVDTGLGIGSSAIGRAHGDAAWTNRLTQARQRARKGLHDVALVDTVDDAIVHAGRWRIWGNLGDVAGYVCSDRARSIGGAIDAVPGQSIVATVTSRQEQGDEDSCASSSESGRHLKDMLVVHKPSGLSSHGYPFLKRTSSRLAWVTSPAATKS